MGDYLDIIESSLPSGTDGPPLHRHLLGDERFEVLDGRLGLLIEDDERVLEAGESLTVRKGIRQAWWNAGEETVKVRGQLRDPGRFEEQLTTYFALTNAGAVNSKGRPNLLQTAVWLAEYRDEYEASTVPAPLRWLLVRFLAPVGRLFGYNPVHAYRPPVDKA